jgi:hypothetical protein
MSGLYRSGWGQPTPCQARLAADPMRAPEPDANRPRFDANWPHAAPEADGSG